MTMSAETLDLKDKCILDFQSLEASLNGQSKTPFHAVRKQAIERFAELGFPTIRNEEWKYTNLMPALKAEYVLSHGLQSQVLKTTLTAKDVAPFLVPSMKANVLVFVNDSYAPELSTIITTLNGVTVSSFAEALQRSPELVQKHFARHAAFENDALAALNTAFAHNGAFVGIAEGVVVEEPFHLVFVNDARRNAVLSQPRNLFLLGANAEATIVESYHTIGSHQGFMNVVGEVMLEENAVLHHYKLQNDAENSTFVGATQVHQEASSVFNSVVISLAGGIIRNNLNTMLAGKATDTHFYGLYMVGGKTLVDNHTLADHAMPHCTSNELYKGILDDRSIGVFNGKIMVRQDAQKTLAYQSNRNILLSPNATMNTKPQLEIFADDVKCSHGATSGQLDGDALFYLRARGLSRERAQALLLYAFAGEVIEKIRIEALREYVDTIIAARLHQEELKAA